MAGELLAELWPTSTTADERMAAHDNLFDTEAVNVGLLLDHLVYEHGVHPDRFDAHAGNRRELVAMHFHHHPARRDGETVQQVVDHVEVHGPIPEGGIVVVRGGEFPPEVFEILQRELVRVAGHDAFVLVLLGADTPGAIAVLDAKMAIDEVKAKLGVD